MAAITSGIYWGLIIAVLVGPVLFILVQAGIERGFRAGVALACGMWVSDLLFILLSYSGLSILVLIVEAPVFETVIGVSGGLILLVLGLTTFTGAAPIIERDMVIEKAYASLWLKGFLVNTFNPFVVVFWIMISTTIVADSFSGLEVVWFFIGILFTVVMTDCLKVYLARGLRKWLTGKHIQIVRHFTGVLLILSGVVFVTRSLT